MAYAISYGSDELAHLHSLIRIFHVCIASPQILSNVCLYKEQSLSTIHIHVKDGLLRLFSWFNSCINSYINVNFSEC